MGDGSEARQAMIELLKSKKDTAEFVHAGVEVDGATLNDLFQEEKYEEILDALESMRSASALTEGDDLVAAGKPGESAFLTQIREGVMQGQFDDEEIGVVERWISSLG